METEVPQTIVQDPTSVVIEPFSSVLLIEPSTSIIRQNEPNKKPAPIGVEASTLIISPQSKRKFVEMGFHSFRLTVDDKESIIRMILENSEPGNLSPSISLVLTISNIFRVDSSTISSVWTKFLKPNNYQISSANTT